jgi:hypothetical protein
VSRRDPLPEPVRRALEDRHAKEPDSRIDIVVEGVRAVGGVPDSETVRAAVARVDGGALATDVPLIGAVASSLRPIDILRLAADPAVARITIDRPEAVELAED